MRQAAYRGRFAPSPTGWLHAGSLVAALASWLDARAHGGTWLVRLEDIDPPRCVAGAAEGILQQLASCGLVSDEPVWVQSQRHAAYQMALDRLIAQGWAYPCTCTRKAIASALAAKGEARNRHGELRYPGICRPPLGTVVQTGPTARHAWRLRTDGRQGQVVAPVLHWHDRRLGPQQQTLADEVGDFVLRRADGLWAYQLAVVVDDAAQGITHIVRGEDLADNTPRQWLLQHALGLPHPSCLHTPLVRAADGEKLSKQNGAIPVDVTTPALATAALHRAAAMLELPLPATSTATSMGDALAMWVKAWRQRWCSVNGWQTHIDRGIGSMGW